MYRRPHHFSPRSRSGTGLQRTKARKASIYAACTTKQVGITEKKCVRARVRYQANTNAHKNIFSRKTCIVVVEKFSRRHGPMLPKNFFRVRQKTSGKSVICAKLRKIARVHADANAE